MTRPARRHTNSWSQRDTSPKADDVLAEGDTYDIVAIKPQYRDPTPPPADL